MPPERGITLRIVEQEAWVRDADPKFKRAWLFFNGSLDGTPGCRWVKPFLVLLHVEPPVFLEIHAQVRRT